MSGHEADMTWQGTAGPGSARHGWAGIDSGPRLGVSDDRTSSGDVVVARGSDHLPQMWDQLTTVRNLLVQAAFQLERECDPSSAPDDDEPVHQLIYAMAHDHIGEAWRLLAELAARFPDRPASPPPPGLRPVPGRAAADPDPAAASESVTRCAETPRQAGTPEPAPGSVAAGGAVGESDDGRLPVRAGVSQRQVMPGTAELAASINTALARRSR